MNCLIAWGLFKAAVVWTVSGLAAVTPVLFEVWVEDNLILWQRQIVVLLRDILCLGGLCASDFFVAGCVSRADVRGIPLLSDRSVPMTNRRKACSGYSDTDSNRRDGALG